jgi:hypothetical protein
MDTPTPNTYELTGDKRAIIVTDGVTGEKTLTPVADLVNKREGVQNSKDLNISIFDKQLEELDRQIAFIEEQTAPQE